MGFFDEYSRDFLKRLTIDLEGNKTNKNIDAEINEAIERVKNSMHPPGYMDPEVLRYFNEKEKAINAAIESITKKREKIRKEVKEIDSFIENINKKEKTKETQEEFKNDIKEINNFIKRISKEEL